MADSTPETSGFSKFFGSIVSVFNAPASDTPAVAAQPQQDQQQLAGTQPSASDALTQESRDLLAKLREDIKSGDYASLTTTLNGLIKPPTPIEVSSLQTLMNISGISEAGGKALLEGQINNGRAADQKITISDQQMHVLAHIPDSSDEALIDVVASLSGKTPADVRVQLNTFAAPKTPTQQRLEAFNDNKESATTPPPTGKTQAQLDEEYKAAVAKVQEYENGLRQRGESPPGEEISSLIGMLGMFTGQNDQDGGIASLIPKYLSQGAEMAASGKTYKIIPGEMGVLPLLAALNTKEDGPVSVPQPVFDAAKKMAISQIVANPSMLEQIGGDNKEIADQMKVFSDMIGGLQTTEEKQQFEQSLQLFLNGRVNSLKFGDQYLEINAETAQQIRQKFDDTVAFTIAAGQQELTGAFKGTGLFGMILGAIMQVAQFVDDMTQKAGLNTNLAGFVQGLA